MISQGVRDNSPLEQFQHPERRRVQSGLGDFSSSLYWNAPITGSNYVDRWAERVSNSQNSNQHMIDANTNERKKGEGRLNRRPQTKSSSREVFNRTQSRYADSGHRSDVKDHENQRSKLIGGPKNRRRGKWQTSHGLHPSVGHAKTAFHQFLSDEDSHYNCDPRLETYCTSATRRELLERLSTWTDNVPLIQWLLDPPIINVTGNSEGIVLKGGLNLSNSFFINKSFNNQSQLINFRFPLGHPRAILRLGSGN